MPCLDYYACYSGSMKTTIDIPDNALREAIIHTGAKTKREAVVVAMNEFNRLRRLKRLATRWQGACPNFMTQQDLQNMRRNRAWEATRRRWWMPQAGLSFCAGGRASRAGG